uniref:Putative ovule protein n=1 Tax=Solanum chacoense TaxID=4108 RepID=A0A0V0GUS1_SOLCH
MSFPRPQTTIPTNVCEQRERCKKTRAKTELSLSLLLVCCISSQIPVNSLLIYFSQSFLQLSQYPHFSPTVVSNTKLF